MRTATTIHRTAAGWVLAAGPDVPADKQRANFNSIGDHWPSGVLEIRFQLNDQPSKSRDKERATTIAEQTRLAEKKSDEKAKNAVKIEADKKAKAEADAAAKTKADDEANAKSIADKEASKLKKPVQFQHQAAAKKA